MKGSFLSLQTSLTSLNFPARLPPIMAEAVPGSFCVLGGKICFGVRLSHLFRKRDAFGSCSLHRAEIPPAGISALTQGQAFTGHLTLGTPFMPRARTVSVRARVFYEPSTTSGRSKPDDGTGVGLGSGSGVGSGSGSCGKSGAGGVGISSPPLMR